MYSLEETICFQLLILRDKIHDALKEDFQVIGITYSNYVALLIIQEHPGLTQAELAQYNHKDRNVIGQTIDKLEEKGYVQRKKDPNDRRVYRLYVTEEGKKILESYGEKIRQSEDAILSMLDQEQRQIFCTALKELTIRR